MTGFLYIGYMSASVLVSQKSFLKMIRSNKLECQGLIRFRAFIEDDSTAVIAQMRKVRDQMRVI